MASDDVLKEIEQLFNANKDKIKTDGLTFGIIGNGTYADVSVHFEDGQQVKPFSFAQATSVKEGSATFTTKYVIVGLSGAYRIKIDTDGAKVLENDELIWFWPKLAAGQPPIVGDVDVVFDHKIITTLAAQLALLYP